MHRIVVSLFAALAVMSSAAPVFAQAPGQTRPAEPPRVVAPGDELKLDESSSLKAAAIQSKMSAILANFALLQRQAQDLQTEMTRALEERKKLIDEAGRKGRVDVRDVNEWVYDEAGQRYIRAKKTP